MNKHLVLFSQVNLAFPIIQLVINFAVLVLGVYQKPRQMGVALLILFAGIPVYWFGVTWKRKPKGFTKLLGTIYCFLM